MTGTKLGLLSLLGHPSLALCVTALWSVQHSGIRVVRFLTCCLKIAKIMPQEKEKKQAKAKFFKDLALKLTQSHAATFY